MLMRGPVRVPADAREGKAIMRVELPPTSEYDSEPTGIEVTITAKA